MSAPRPEDWRALCPLISVFTHPLPARDFPRRNSSRLRRRPFLAPHLSLSDQISKSLSIREVIEISTLIRLSTGSRDNHFLDDLSICGHGVIFALKLREQKAERPSCMYETKHAIVVRVATQEPATYTFSLPQTRS